MPDAISNLKFKIDINDVPIFEIYHISKILIPMPSLYFVRFLKMSLI